MPPISQYPSKWRSFKRRNAYSGNRYYKPSYKRKFISRNWAMKRKNQVSTKTFIFRSNGVIQSDLAGNRYEFFRTQDLKITAPVGWAEIAKLYQQFKTVQMKLSMFPSNVGVEPDSVLIGGSNALLRGDTIVWSTQRWTRAAPQLISEVINYASARMINSRQSYTRVISRPPGHPQWGDTQSIQDDPWNAAISVIINGATPQPATPGATAPVLWYYTLEWKVILRGRVQT